MRTCLCFLWFMIFCFNHWYESKNYVFFECKIIRMLCILLECVQKCLKPTCIFLFSAYIFYSILNEYSLLSYFHIFRRVSTVSEKFTLLDGKWHVYGPIMGSHRDPMHRSSPSPMFLYEFFTLLCFHFNEQNYPRS